MAPRIPSPAVICAGYDPPVDLQLHDAVADPDRHEEPCLAHNGGCSYDGFDYLRGWLMLQGRETFGQAVADPDSLADLAAARLVIANQAIVECEFALYIPARAHSPATGDEIPDDAYRTEPLELLGGWDFNFDE